jgi:hypothetical protein
MSLVSPLKDANYLLSRRKIPTAHARHERHDRHNFSWGKYPGMDRISGDQKEL